MELVGGAEVWTLSLPVEVARAHPTETLDVLWRLGAAHEPCVAGAEYSMAGVCRASFDVALEAATEHSLATHVVVRARDRLAGWSVLREDGERVLVRRSEALP